jgi:hypothetical protein
MKTDYHSRYWNGIRQGEEREQITTNWNEDITKLIRK